MTSTPFDQQPASQRPWVKRAAALLLLLLLAYVGFLAVRYFITGKPVGELGLPKPIANALVEQPRYTGSIEDISAPIGVAIVRVSTISTTESEGQRMIRSYDSSGAPIAAFAPPRASHTPVYVAINPEGKVFVSDRNAATIDIFTPAGEWLGEVTPPEELKGWQPIGLAFDPAGNLYVTDVTPDRHRLIVLDPEFKLVTQFGTQGSGAGEFYYPNSLVVDGKGRIWVADSNNGRVVAFDKTGKTVATIGRGLGSGDLGLPRGVAIDTGRDYLYVVDTTAQGVKAYNISGSTPKYLFDLGDVPVDGGFAYPNGVAFDGKSKLIITDRVNNRVQVWRN